MISSRPLSTPALQSAIPIVVGNLGARAIIDAARGRPPSRDPLFDDLARLADLGVCAIEDYVGWSVVEPRRGAFDFRLHLEQRAAVERLGMRYVAYPWMHALPGFARAEIVPFRCVEHGRDTIAPSIFAPATLDACDRFLALLRRELGDLGQMTLALPCDYGEVGYPTGMGAWVLDLEGDEKAHCHEGFWCGDDSARRAFRTHLRGRFGSLAALNAVLGTRFPSDDDVMPLPHPEQPRFTDRWRFELIGWYRAALLGFVAALVDRAREHFPRAELGLKCGYGGEKAPWGIDYAGLAALARDRDVALWSTHGTLPVVFHKRIQSLCRHRGVRYCTEGLTERTREHVLDRLFEDAADGAAAFFEFHETLRQHESDVIAHSRHLRGRAPDVDVGLVFAATSQWREPRQSLPPNLQALSDPLRDVVDWEIVDESELADASIASRHRAIALTDPGAMDARALAGLVDFAEAGGLLVIPARPELHRIGGASAPAGLRGGAGIEGVLEFSPSADGATRLDFGAGDELLLASGHGGVEAAAPYFARPLHPRARWSCGPFRFRLPRPEQPARLELTLFADARALAQPWRLLHGGRPLATITESGAATLSVPLPGIAGTDLLFALDGPTFRPAESGGDDSRELGILLHAAELRIDGSSGDPRPPRLSASADLDALAAGMRRIGRGGILFAPAGDAFALVAFTAAAVALASGRRGRIDVSPGGVRAARFGAETLAYNRSDVPQPFGGATLAPREIRAFRRD